MVKRIIKEGEVKLNPRIILKKLIKLLIEKGIITKEEVLKLFE